MYLLPEAKSDIILIEVILGHKLVSETLTEVKIIWIGRLENFGFWIPGPLRTECSSSLQDPL